MRKILGLVAIGLGAFLLVTALLAWVYAPGQFKRTPLDTNSTTQLSGTATYRGEGPGPVKAVSRSVVVGERSDDDVSVFTSTSCLVWDKGADSPSCVSVEDPQKRLITAGQDLFATDRRTGLSVNETKYIGQGTPHEGLVNKFPFDAEKKTYPFWDGLLGRSVDAAYAGEDTVGGLKTYKYVIDVRDEPAEIARDVQGTYSTRKTIWADPVTGALIKQTEQQQRTLDGETVVDLDFGFTEDQVAKNVKDAKANGTKLSLLGVLPLVALALGIFGVGLGAFLLRGQQARVQDEYETSLDDLIGAHSRR